MRFRLILASGAVGLMGRLPLPAADLVVPVVLDVRSGTAHFRTELTLTNRGTAPVELALTYRGSLGAAAGIVPENLPGGTQMTIPDVVGYLSDHGIDFASLSDGAPHAGTLRITVPDSRAASLSALARTTSPTSAPHPAGAAGLAYAAAAPAAAFAGQAVVHGLRASSSERSNLAVFNPGTSQVTVRIVAASGAGDGREVIAAEGVTLEAGEWRQIDGILAKAGIEQGWAVVERTGGGVFGTYGVVNDEGTNDGSFLEAAADTAASPLVTVPALVETPAFRTELVLANRGSKEAVVTLDYREALSPACGAGGSVTVTLAPREQRIVPEALAWLRRLGVEAGPFGAASYAGRLRVSGGAGATALHAGARVSSISSGGGSYGVFLPGVAPGAELSDEGVVTGLRADSEIRSNIAFVHAGGAGSGPVVLEMQLFDGESARRRRGPSGGDPPRGILLGPALRPPPGGRCPERVGASPKDLG